LYLLVRLSVAKTSSTRGSDLAQAIYSVFDQENKRLDIVMVKRFPWLDTECAPFIVPSLERSAIGSTCRRFVVLDSRLRGNDDASRE
jgi:hypothetical protein